MVSAKQTGKAGVSWYAVLAAGLAVASAYSTPSIASTDSVVECEQIGGQGTSADIGPPALSFEAVDHIATEDPGVVETPIDTPQETSETPTPVLYLTPRVASILRDVFGSEIEGSSRPIPNPSKHEARSTEPVAPIADRTESSDAPESEEISHPVPLIDEAEDLRRFKPEMYRTDI